MAMCFFVLAVCYGNTQVVRYEAILLLLSKVGVQPRRALPYGHIVNESRLTQRTTGWGHFWQDSPPRGNDLDPLFMAESLVLPLVILTLITRADE